MKIIAYWHRCFSQPPISGDFIEGGFTLHLKFRIVSFHFYCYWDFMAVDVDDGGGRLFLEFST